MPQYPTAAAIDIGSTMHMAAVSPDSTDRPVRAFGAFTRDLHDLADWFRSCGVTSVAMELTGVYWIPAFEILEQHVFHVILVSARYAKNVPGRKTDVSDAGWLRQLHSYGLLRGSFRPEAEIATLRAYMRQCERLVEYAAAHIQHMQKALMSEDQQRCDRGCLFMLGVGVIVIFGDFAHCVAELRREVRVAGQALQDGRIEHLQPCVLDCLHSVGCAPSGPSDAAVQKSGHMRHKLPGPADRGN